MKQLTTLCLIRSDSRVLLGLKKRGFGKGRWNGFGGKVKPSESIDNALRRELYEECGLTAGSFLKRGILNFEFQNGQDPIEMHIFESRDFKGEPQETEEMRPQWFNESEIPFDEMWVDDKIWLPVFLKGIDFEGYFVFKDFQNLADYKIRELNRKQ
jgi:8-oxo-dGTP diphosphatase / 2-hydroxy-dATP diphosphatase